MRLAFLLPLLSLAVLPLGAQTLKPVVTLAPGDLTVQLNAPDTVVDLRTVFAIDGVTGPIVRFDTIRGLINVELFEDDAPITVQNFLDYTGRKNYDNTVIHRVETGFVIQGGGFKLPSPPTDFPLAFSLLPPIKNEAGRSNLRGTLAMARATEFDSATSQWFFNLADNTFLDDPKNPYAVFGRVIGDSIQVVDAIGRIQPYDMGVSPFNAFPLINPSGTLVTANYVTVFSVRRIPAYPAAGETLAALTFSAGSSNPNLVRTSLEDSRLRLSFQTGQSGQATITLVCSDSDNSTASTSFQVEVTSLAPVITGQPLGRVVRLGDTMTLQVEAEASTPPTFQWRRNGQILSGQTSPTLVLGNVEASDAGAYDVIVTNSEGSVTSDLVFVTATNEMGYLVNLSTRSVTSVEPPFVWTTPGFVTRGSGTINILARAVGPGLGAFEVAGFLPNPMISVLMLEEPKTVIKVNDDWEGNDNLTELKVATLTAGAFDLEAGSKDAAVLTTISSNAYTANIFSQDGVTTGVVLGEIYRVGDPVPGGSALVNLSNRGHVGSGAEVMIGGFAVSGPGPVNLLIRGIGPTLGGFGVTGVLEDPVLTIRDQNNIVVGVNDDWEADGLGSALAGLATSVGAFPLHPGSADSALLLVLNPGRYTAVFSGKSGGSGTGLVEFYLVP